MDYAVAGADLAPICSAREPIAGRRQGCVPSTKVQLAGQNCPVQGIHRPLPCSTNRGDRGRWSTNHVGGRLRRSEYMFLDRQPKTHGRNSLYSPPDSRRRTCLRVMEGEVYNSSLIRGQRASRYCRVPRGIRTSQVTVIAQTGGWYLRQDLTSTLLLRQAGSSADCPTIGYNERW